MLCPVAHLNSGDCRNTFDTFQPESKLSIGCHSFGMQVWRNTLVQVRQKVADREAEMAAWAQDLYDDVGKARADLANTVRYASCSTVKSGLICIP